jgi:hypothetical protein
MYNSGFASVFDVPTTNARDVSVNYVGVLKVILKLNYDHGTIIINCLFMKLIILYKSLLNVSHIQKRYQNDII